MRARHWAGGLRGDRFPTLRKRRAAWFALLRSRTRAGLACVLVAGLGGSPADGPSGRDVILGMMAARVRGADATSVFRVETIDAGGQAASRTVLTQRTLCDGAVRSLVFFRDPADVAGTGFLSWSYPDRVPDMWLYLPELGRVRQINGRTVGESFMGTDFTYEDLGAVPVDARSHRLVRREVIDGQEAYQVVSTPRIGGTYGKIVSWVTSGTFLPIRIDYYDAAREPLKVARFSDVRVVKDVPTIFAIEVHNVQTDHRTRLTLLEAEYDRGLDCGRFTPRHLARGP